jgi:hypothetical protein
MRLLRFLDDDTLSLTEFISDGIPPYAILSHVWGLDGSEVTYKDVMEDTVTEKYGYQKIVYCGGQAAGSML